MPKRAETWLFPVATPEVGNLLTLRAVSRKESDIRPAWEGAYAYARDGDGWSCPHRLPTVPATRGHDLLVPDPDGRLWCASVHDVWVGDNLDGPWERVPWQGTGEDPIGPGYAPVPDLIAAIWPVGGGVLWLTSTFGVGGGCLYRSDDDGATGSGCRSSEHDSGTRANRDVTPISLATVGGGRSPKRPRSPKREGLRRCAIEQDLVLPL